METLNHWLQNTGFSILMIIVGLALAYYFGSKVLNFVTRQLVRGKDREQPEKDIAKRQDTLGGLVVAVWRTAVVALAVISIFKELFPAIDLSPLFAGAGIIGIAVAFGSQALVKDFLSGIFIVSDNQYRVGDYVDINGASGKVERLGTRTTVIRDTDGNVHYIPNGTITHVINKTMGYSRIYFTLSLEASTDLDKAISVINQTGDQLATSKKWAKKVLEAPQFDSVEAITAKSIDVTVIGKTQPSDQWAATAEMRRRLLREFEDNDIKLA